ncbi:hypothetical protein BJ684DRAFT_6943 [Piptocephalis cylindrospora]|uniref:Ubiquitin carboxyl-terminal hydrolase n=1 Tax=Piptocephalis cylindrospora TaxID=1907219 RepID=A0A4P9Y8W9_9FUNG|nr:hypothetical protein BJ684DRAFT_6943 [Piptocephalis cylindrospora]|eukprot:RKP15485.1 hypothetical protein BJ684DRAFT_6943 [Piptocephalis cylindrospora]
MSCPHTTPELLASLQVPSPNTVVYREECTQCFDDQDGPWGVQVCLHCFNGGCMPTEGKGASHATHHASLKRHPLSVNIRRFVQADPGRSGDEEAGTPPPNKLTKLAIDPAAQEVKYDYQTSIYCHECQSASPDPTQPQIALVVQGIRDSLAASQRTEVKAWEAEVGTCDHVDQLASSTPSSEIDLSKCSQCDLRENLWICLHCGALGCGRQQFGGIGGNGHALDHFHTTGHMVACKLGTITPEGSADVYCYQCDDERVDKRLADHLSPFGINVSIQTKTEKSLAELQLEQNLKFDFSMEYSDGKQMIPISGPGLTGFKNLGNSCYLASVMQSLIHLSGFQDAFYSGDATKSLTKHVLSCTKENPAKCWDCQMEKLVDGVLSGRYGSKPCASRSEEEGKGQKGIPPFMFKSLIGEGHEEFSTMRQQDAAEFLQHILRTTERQAKASSQGTQDPSKDFSFQTEQRLECLSCHGVRYTTDTTTLLQIPVPKRLISSEGTAQYEEVGLTECLEAFVAPEVLEGWMCPRCQKATQSSKSTRFKTFPKVLALVFQRFEVENWVPKKLAIPISFPEPGKPLSLESYRSHGKQEGEEELPEETTSSTAPKDSLDPMALQQLESMGFPVIRCQRALLATGNNGAEVAMNWLFEHMEDPDIDAPLPSTAGGQGSNLEVSEEHIASLTELGFNPGQAKVALRETNGDMERAVDWLFNHPEIQGDEGESEMLSTDLSESQGQGKSKGTGSYQISSVISHRGTSMHCGHYVVDIVHEDRWVLMNDERVVLADQIPQADVYLALFTAITTA